MISPETGETSQSTCPAIMGDGVHVGSDLGAADKALRNLKENVEGILSPATIRRVRTKLKALATTGRRSYFVSAKINTSEALLSRVVLPFN